jgi:hypothetical protein
MSRKDFIALARALASTRPPATIIREYSQWMEDRRAILSALRVNPRFDAGRFVLATEADL